MNIKKICHNCYRVFFVHTRRTSNQKKCPVCAARANGKRSLQVKRNLKHARIMVIESLPKTEWERCDPAPSSGSQKNEPYYRMETLGCHLGENGEGRFSIFSSRPFNIGDVVFARWMTTKHLVKSNDNDDPVLEYRRHLSLKVSQKEPEAKLTWITEDSRSLAFDADFRFCVYSDSTCGAICSYEIHKQTEDDTFMIDSHETHEPKQEDMSIHHCDDDELLGTSRLRLINTEK